MSRAFKIERCDRTLLYGRTCCRVKGHGGKHLHTWQTGDARYLEIDEKLIDMETGEVTGYCGELGQRILEEIIAERDSRKPESREQVQAKARRTLKMQYGFDITEQRQPVHAAPPKGYRWHYEGTYKAYGTDDSGNDVEFDFRSNRVSRIYSVNQRREAIAYARRYGSVKAAQKFGIPSATIRQWIVRRQNHR